MVNGKPGTEKVGMKRYIRLFRNVSNWWKHFAVKAGVNREDPIFFHLKNGVRMEVPAVLYHEFKEIIMEDCYLMGLDEPLSNAPVVVDIGANAGFFCLYVASMRPEALIVSCEPIPANFEQLSRNTSINPDLDITALPVAVYDRTGSIELLVESENAFTTAATVFPIDGRIPVKVDCVRLQDLLDRHGLERVDLLKLDCEGSEYAILYNCPPDYLKRVEKLAVEVHSGTETDHNIGALAKFLADTGFRTHTAGHMLWARRDIKAASVNPRR